MNNADVTITTLEPSWGAAKELRAQEMRSSMICSQSRRFFFLPGSIGNSPKSINSQQQPKNCPIEIEIELSQ